MPFANALTSVEALREIYPSPAKPSVAKEIDHLDHNCRSFIAHSPFVVIATSDASGACDASPKGGPAGFVSVLDDHRLAIPDLSGNNRLDSFGNLISNPAIALLFCIPGVGETLRVNGQATITTDPDVIAATEVRGIVPKVAIGIDVVTAFLHCAKALRRGSLWDPSGWPDLGDLPSIPCMLRDHYAMPEMDLEAVQRRLEESYEHRMWAVGGLPTT
jgi:PPOX class probable FMN-dependent enzyme